jgi:drug/metabolite transporter (DMT)-like permease
MLCYAIGGVYASIHVRTAPPLTVAVGQQLSAGLVLLPFAMLSLPDEPPTPRVVLALLALAFLTTALAYTIYFRLLRSIGPTKTASVTFLIPGFGLLWGVLFLDEPVGPGVFAGLAVILAGVVLITGVRFGVPFRVGRAIRPSRGAGTPPEY